MIDLEQRIADLDTRITRLSAYIDQHIPGENSKIDTETYIKLLALHGQLCSRLGRLLRDQHQLQGSEGSDIEQAMHEALELAGQMLGIDL
jgi:hypothetical protein